MISPTRLTLLDDTAHYLNAAFDHPQGYFFIYDAAIKKSKMMKRPANAPGPDCDSVIYCRESFSNVWAWGNYSDRRLGYFLHAGLDIERIDAFFGLIHKALGIENQITLHPTDTSSLRASGSTNRAVVIDIPEWWTANSLRREMLTLFIRCSVLHNKGDLDSSFKAYSLLTEVRGAVNLFLDGYTYAYGSWPGVMCIHFRHKADAHLKTLIFRTQGESDDAKKVADEKAATTLAAQQAAIAAAHQAAAASAQAVLAQAQNGANGLGIPMGVPPPQVLWFNSSPAPAPAPAPVMTFGYATSTSSPLRS